MLSVTTTRDTTLPSTPTDAVVVAYDSDDTHPYTVALSSTGAPLALTQSEFDDAKAAHPTVSCLHYLHTRIRARRRNLKILDLCAGTKSVSKAARRLFKNCTIITVDLSQKYDPTYIMDVRFWNELKRDFDIGAFDMIWASPPCDQYSKAHSCGIRDIADADSKVRACMDIIEYFQPKLWVIENPEGLLRTRPFMGAMEKHMHTVSYCKYGFDYRKLTNIWTNAKKFVPRACPHSPCGHVRRTGRHPRHAQCGPAHDGTPGLGSSDAAYAVPPRLVAELLVNAI